jgi:transposase InsO family protein
MSYSATDKLNIIKYSYQYGIDTTLEALRLDSHKNLSKRTLIRWRNRWKLSCETEHGNYEIYNIPKKKIEYKVWKGGDLRVLSDKSKKPIHCRQSKVSGEILVYVQELRLKYPNLGKDKLKVLVDKFVDQYNLNISLGIQSGSYLKSISISTIGRIIDKFKKQRIIPTFKYSKQVYLDGRSGQIKQRLLKSKKQTKRRRKSYQPNKPGDLIQLDAITFYLNGTRRYFVCAVDLVSRYSFVYSYKSLSSNSTKDFFLKMEQVFPYKIKRVQTDNGSENHKSFQELLESKEITQFWNYPRSPKMNAYIERFNRTIQEEFANYNLWLLRDDIQTFNIKLQSYLDFYNTQRPHLGLKRDTGHFISPMEYLKQYHQKCHM